jgi:SAM-dependent methyltransferase
MIHWKLYIPRVVVSYRPLTIDHRLHLVLLFSFYLQSMAQLITYTTCPVCQSDKIQFALQAKDYTVSQTNFDIWECSNCQLRFTQNIPVQEEIGPYYNSDTYISHSETNKGLTNKLYLFVRNRTMMRKQALLQRYTKLAKGNLLDVGCGAGSFMETMKAAGWDATGLEPDLVTRNKVIEKGLTVYENGKLFELLNEQYDAITLWHVLEHVHQLHAYIMQFQKIVKANGRVFIAVPNYTSLDAKQYGAAWAAYDVPRHLYHFAPNSVKQLVEKHGFVVETMLPMLYDSYYISMLSEPFKNGKSNFLAACWNGLRSNWQAWRNVEKCSSIIYILKKQV